MKDVFSQHLITTIVYTRNKGIAHNFDPNGRELGHRDPHTAIYIRDGK